MTVELTHLVEAVAEHYRNIASQPVVRPVDREEIVDHLTRCYGGFQEPLPLDDLISDVAYMLGRWGVQVTHPRYFGLFCPGVTLAGVAGDTLAAAFNPQLAAWSHAPAANEIERYTLDFLTRAIGFDPEQTSAHFTSGGTEANLTAVLVALQHLRPEQREGGVAALLRRPTIYISAGGHHSFEKIAQITGLGRSALRMVGIDRRLRLSVPRLERTIHADRARGLAPLMVVATAGATSTGAIDLLPELARLCRREGIWLHVDAAWGGGALLSPQLRVHLKGIEQADSVTWDAHKWLSVPMGAGMFFCRHRRSVERAFAVETGYMPPDAPGAVEPYTTSVQWSRRFIGLKLFMTLAELGADGYAAQVERQAKLGELLRSELRSAGWCIENDTPLPVVCFTHPEVPPERLPAIVQALQGEGSYWISTAELSNGRPVLRACITSFRTNESDVKGLVAALDAWRSVVQA
ncbi:MAG TPA: aminotransferase class V-fold PLP-dependent enzyme [Longimicrobiales bacterium]